MSNDAKIRVAVLYGGRSGEHEISLISATNVIQNLDRSLFDVVPIGIDKQGGWYLGDDVLKKGLNEPTMLRLHRETERMLFNPDLIGKSLAMLPSSQAQFAQADRLFDVIFPVIHGPLCEDGTIQGLLELAEVPYVGCGVLSSAIGMDKDISKRLVQQANIATPPFLVVKRDQWDHHPGAFCERVKALLNYPVFVKPANTGSSVGISKVKTADALRAAINTAFLYDTKVIVEQGINAIEIECAVLESLQSTDEPMVSVPGEIRPEAKHEFYSYASKYLDEHGAELVIPAPLSQDIQQKVRHVAKDIFSILDCEGMARVDLLLDRDTNRIYFNEINTIPGFTKISMYPKLMEASGLSYKDLLTHLVNLAIRRQTRRATLSREYLPHTG